MGGSRVALALACPVARCPCTGLVEARQACSQHTTHKKNIDATYHTAQHLFVWSIVTVILFFFNLKSRTHLPVWSDTRIFFGGCWTLVKGVHSWEQKCSDFWGKSCQRFHSIRRAKGAYGRGNQRSLRGAQGNLTSWTWQGDMERGDNWTLSTLLLLLDLEVATNHLVF